MKFQRNPGDRELPRKWRAVLMNDPCVYCGGTAAGLDHIESRSDDGHDGWSNRAPACVTCDQSKGPIPLVFFLAFGQYAAYRANKRTRYQSKLQRDAAIRAMREQMSQAFYRGNIRLLANGRMLYDHRTINIKASLAS